LITFSVNIHEEAKVCFEDYFEKSTERYIINLLNKPENIKFYFVKKLSK
jgi:hypothetical protein